MTTNETCNSKTLALCLQEIDLNPPVDTGSSSALTGEIKVFPALTVPEGYLECNGAAVSREEYADLFALIGTTYGTGDEVSTFNIPDLRGEFVRGFDNGRGVDVDRVFASSQEDAFQGHGHKIRHATYNSSQGFANNNNLPWSWDGNQSRTDLVQDAVEFNGNGIPRISNETRPRNVAMMYIIKT